MLFNELLVREVMAQHLREADNARLAREARAAGAAARGAAAPSGAGIEPLVARTTRYRLGFVHRRVRSACP